MSTPATIEFYNTLFDQDDHTCFGTWRKYESFSGCNESLIGQEGIWDRRIHSCFDKTFWKKEYLVINPMRFGSTRSIENITKFRSFLVEMDNHTIDEQKQIIKDKGMPWSTAVYSGGKSIHFIISLETPVTGEEYRRIARKIYDAMEIKSLKEDQGNKNASRFSRCPNAFRRNKRAYQHLLKVNGRIPNQVLFDWFDLMGIKEENYIKKEVIVKEIPVGSIEADVKEKWATVKYWNRSINMADNIHGYLFAHARDCYKTSMSEEDAVEMMNEFRGRVQRTDKSGNDTSRNVTDTEIVKAVKETYIWGVQQGMERVFVEKYDPVKYARKKAENEPLSEFLQKALDRLEKQKQNYEK